MIALSNSHSMTSRLLSKIIVVTKAAFVSLGLRLQTSSVNFLGSIGNSNYLTTQVIPDVNSSYDAYVASGFEEVEEKKSVYLAHLDNKNRVITNILYFSGLYLTSQIISFWDLGKIIPSDNSSLEFNVKEDQALLEYRFGF